MSSSPWPPTAGVAPAPPLEEATAAAAAATTSVAGSTPTSEHPPEGGVAAVQLQQEEKTKPQLPRDDDSEAEIQEHERKINKYRAILAARLKAKFFSKKDFDGGNIFEAVTVVQGETIQSSRWPCTRSFANPEFFCRDKNNHEKGTPSSSADFSAKNTFSPLAGETSPKNNASALATENNLTPGKRPQSKKA